MGVVFQPLDHHKAIQQEISSNLASSEIMRCWNHKLQPTITTTLTLTTHPLVLQENECVDKSVDTYWLSETSKCQLCVSVMDSATNQQHSYKRCAGSSSATSGRSMKRQRVSTDHAYEPLGQESDRLSIGFPNSLQYALPGLSSHDTLYVLHAMRVIPSELRHLNGSASRSRLKRRSKVRQVFGWRHLLCQENDDEKTACRVVWKSAKALDSMKMRPLARQIWRASTEATGGLSGKETGEVLYNVNHMARVVHSTKRQYGSQRHARDQVWIECYLDDGMQICVARKELRQFDAYRAPETSATECQGFLVRPMYTRAINSRLVGCSLQCLQAVDARDCGVRSSIALKQRMLDDLPRLTLQCEENYLYDLVQIPQLLLESVFASNTCRASTS